MEISRPRIIQYPLMTLRDAALQYLVYVQALRLPQKKVSAYRRTVQNIIWFYGSDKPLDAFDDATVLQYIKVFDPFDCDPVHEERGNIYCYFIDWLMRNQMIPAWSSTIAARVNTRN